MSNRRIDNLREPSNVHFRVQTGFPTATDATEGTLSLRYISGTGLCLFAYYANRWNMVKLSPMNAKDEMIIENLVVKNLNVDKTAKFNLSKVDVSDKNIPKIRKWDKSYIDMRSGEVDVHFKGINSSGMLISKEVHSVNDITVGNGTEDAAIQSKGDNNLILKTGNATTSNLTIVDGGDGDVQVNTDGTGKLSVGSGSAAGVVSSIGDHDLLLQTGNATTGNITIADGASGTIKLMPNTDGEIAIGNGVQTGKLTTRGTTDLVLSTNSGVNSGTITITDAVNQSIALAPNGTGDVSLTADNVVVGPGDAQAVIKSSGDHNLVLKTGNSTTGTIVIEDGAAGDISINPAGTGIVTTGRPIGFTHYAASDWDDNAGAESINFSTEGNKARVAFTGADITIDNTKLIFPANISGNYTLLVKMYTGGSITKNVVTLWTSHYGAVDTDATNVIWQSGAIPEVTEDQSHMDIFSFYWDSDEKKAYGVATQGFEVP